MNPTGLRALARLHGIQTAYYDINKRREEARQETLLSTLQSLGAPIEHPHDTENALLEKRRAIWNRLIEPVIVVWNGGPVEIELRLPARASRETLRFRIEFENGGELAETRRVSSIPTRRKEVVGGDAYIAKGLRIRGNLPYGYHELRVETSTATARSTLLSAPIEAYSPPDHRRGTWGLFVPLYALHSERSWGAGDFTDLSTLVDWTADLGGGVVSTLPFLAAFLDEPFDPSPYSPASRLFWNEMFVDPTRAPEWEVSVKARQSFESGAFQKELRALRSSSGVEYRRLFAQKRMILELLAEVLYRGSGSRRDELERFVASRPLLRDYAHFRAAAERHRTPWTTWPSRARNGALESGDYRKKDVRYHLYAQWLAHDQVRRLSEKARRAGAGLYLDLPLGTHPHGFDVWRERDLFVRDVTVGAPPDPVFTSGQDWGFHPVHPERSREQGHRYLIACFRHQLASAGLLRIDHVMGLHRMFWIPGGFDFKDGVYVRYPAEELYAILSLESHRHRSIIVGENLGIVPAYVNQHMNRHNVQQMYLMQYALRPDPEHPMKPIPSGSVAGLNSHDTPLFASFWQRTDIEDRLALGLVDPEGARKERRERKIRQSALLAYLKKKGLLRKVKSIQAILEVCLARLRGSRAGIALVNLEDLWLETKPQNIPGSGERRPNWRRKTRFSFEQFSTNKKVLGLLKRVQSGAKK